MYSGKLRLFTCGILYPPQHKNLKDFKIMASSVPLFFSTCINNFKGGKNKPEIYMAYVEMFYIKVPKGTYSPPQLAHYLSFYTLLSYDKVLLFKMTPLS